MIPDWARQERGYGEGSGDGYYGYDDGDGYDEGAFGDR